MLNGFMSYFGVRPAKSVDGSLEIAPRGNGYGEGVNQSSSPDGLDVALGESSYISGALASYTPGSSYVTGAVQTSFSPTSALFMIRNNAPLNGAPINVRPDTLKLICLAAGTGITSMHIAAVLDNGARWGSNPGGSAMSLAPSSNTGAVQSSLAQAVAGGLGPQAITGAMRFVGRCVLKAAAPVVGDELILRFSNAAQPSGSIAATTASTIIRHIEPVLIAPGQALILHAWFPGGTVGANFEPMWAHIER